MSDKKIKAKLVELQLILYYTSMRKELFLNDNFYHIYNRGVDKRIVFQNDGDMLRFVHTLYVLNNFREMPSSFNIFTLEPKKLLISLERPYVEVVAGCLIPNHYHLLLSPLQQGGISNLLQKIGTSYTKYFNIKYKRTGRLFESTFKAKHVMHQEYASYLTEYIHLNAQDLFTSRSGAKELLQKVENYQWSTLPDYLDQKSHFSPAVSMRFRNDILDMNAEQYRKFFHEFYFSSR